MSKPENAVSPEYIFSALGIAPENASAWEGLTTLDLLRSLRRSAAWTVLELASHLTPSVSKDTVRQLERTCSRTQVDRILEALKPRLEEMVNAGWIDPVNFAVRKDCYDKIAYDCKQYRSAKGLSASELTRQLKITKGHAFDISDFEVRPNSHCLGPHRSLANLILVAQLLCDYFEIESNMIGGLSITGHDGMPLVKEAFHIKGRGM